MRTESKQGVLENMKDRSQLDAVFEHEITVTYSSDGKAAYLDTLVGCKLLDGTELEKTDFHGNEWRHPDQVVFYKKL